MIEKQNFKNEEINFLNQDNNSIRLNRSIAQLSEYNYNTNNNLQTLDQLFGSHYDSDKDEDYSVKEDLI